jgi:arabinofuranosyltransferase
VEITTSVLWTYLLAATRFVVPVPVEWLAVVLGLACTLGGLLLASLAALRLWCPRSGPVAPLGSLVVVALPPVWDFATSGLETGLSFFWLGASFWLLTRTHATEPQPRSSRLLSELLATAFVLGLGPLVRPDFAVFSAGFLVGLIVLAGGPWRRRVALVAASVALPALYQVFRMGYYAALVPNPALGKEATLARWSVGWGYAVDLFSPDWLLAPLAVVLAAGAVSVAASVRGRAWGHVVVVAVPVATALLHGVYIVRVGGDFMHGRLLLPAVFALVMPFMVVTVTDFARLACVALTVGWAVLSMSTLRLPYERVGPRGIADERGHYVAASGKANPVTLQDYRAVGWARDGMAARRWADEGRRVLVTMIGAQSADRLIDLVPQLATTVAIEHTNVGIVGVAAGGRVHVVDFQGLGDPVGARLRLERRGRPGHEKLLDRAWVLARYADPAAPLPSGTSAARVDAARRALGCGDLSTLQEAIHDRLTAGDSSPT